MRGRGQKSELAEELAEASKSTLLLKSEESSNLKCNSLTNLKARKLNSRTSHIILGTESWFLGQHINQTQHKFSSTTSVSHSDSSWFDPHSAAMLNNLNNHLRLSAEQSSQRS